MKARKHNLGQQCMQLLNYFQLKLKVEEGFFFKTGVDENNQGRNIFWVDNMSRIIYVIWK